MKKKIMFFLIIIMIIFLIIYVIYENNTLSISYYKIIDEIPNNFNNLKIAHISDFHNNHSSTINNNLIISLKSEKPDLIFITGDLIDSYKPDIRLEIELIKKIKDIAPIYYVNGNHESRLNNYDDLINQLRDNGVYCLINEEVKITKGEEEITIIGLEDPSFLNVAENELKNKVNEQLKLFSQDGYRILLSHRPEYFSLYVENKFNLIFSGHAHGGQIRLPFIGGLFAPHQGFFPKYTSGVIEKNNSKMVVSRGLGNSLLRYRINNKCELVYVTLVDILN